MRRVKVGLQLGKVRLTVVAEQIQHGRRIRYKFLTVLFLAVQHAQGVAVKACLAGAAHFANAPGQERLERCMVLRAAVRAANGVNVDGQVLHAQSAQQTIRQQNQLRVRRSIPCAEAFQTELVMLAQAAALRRLIAENRGVQVVHFAGQRVGIEIILQQAARRARRAFGFERNGAVALVLEGVHFLLHNVRGIAHAAQKQFRMLKHGRADFAETRFRRRLAHLALNVLPTVGISRQHILCAAGCLRQH